MISTSDFFFKLKFLLNYFRNTIKLILSIGLAPDQDQRSVGPDLDPNRLKMRDTCTLTGTMVQSGHLTYNKWGLMPPYPLN